MILEGLTQLAEYLLYSACILGQSITAFQPTRLHTDEPPFLSQLMQPVPYYLDQRCEQQSLPALNPQEYGSLSKQHTASDFLPSVSHYYLPRLIVHWRTHKLIHTYTYSHTLFNYSYTHSLTHTDSHTFTHSITHTLDPSRYSHTHTPTHSLTKILEGTLRRWTHVWRLHRSLLVSGVLGDLL